MKKKWISHRHTHNSSIQFVVAIFVVIAVSIVKTVQL